jgi:hypothetical protein
MNVARTTNPIIKRDTSVKNESNQRMRNDSEKKQRKLYLNYLSNEIGILKL